MKYMTQVGIARARLTRHQKTVLIWAGIVIAGKRSRPHGYDIRKSTSMAAITAPIVTQSKITGVAVLLKGKQFQ